MQTILIIICIVTSVIQLYFWVIQLGALSRGEKKVFEKSHYPALTIVIAAQNEKINLEKHLSSWVNLDYPKYHIIVINDRSSDGTAAFLENHVSDRLTVLHLPENQRGKKHALAYGIKHASTEWIVSTDADCFPESHLWLQELMNEHAHSDVILGYSPIIKSNGGLLETLISYETWYIAVQYLSAAQMGRAYMGVGRNMAFKKSIYSSVGGYESHEHIKSGDDDLFIASLQKKARFAIVTSAASRMWTYPKTTFGAYWQQKRRHLTSAPHYKLKTRVWLSALYLSQLFWYISVIGLSIMHPWMLVFFLLRGLIILYRSYRPGKEVLLNPAYLLAPFYDLILCLFYLFLSFTFVVPRKEW